MKIIIFEKGVFPHPFTIKFACEFKRFVAEEAGEDKEIAATQVVRMKKRHSLEPMSGGRRGKTTAPNRSTAIRTRFSIDTTQETYCINNITLQKAWPCSPLKNQNPPYMSIRIDGKTKIGNRRSDMAMFKIK